MQDSFKFCGITSFLDSYEFISCSNTLTLTYTTGNTDGLQDYYRGFRSYYEIIDLPSTCSGASTTPSIPTTSYFPPTYPVSKEVFSSVLAIDSLNGMGTCSFPFKYQGEMKDKCLLDSTSGKYWCSTTPDYDKDKQMVCLYFIYKKNDKFSKL